MSTQAILTPAQQAYLTIKKTLLDERLMRERVFKEPHKRAQKTLEIDEALQALELLALTIRDLKNELSESQTERVEILGITDIDHLAERAF